MNIYDAINFYSSVLPNAHSYINLWRIERALENKSTYIVPSVELINVYQHSIPPMEHTQICGIDGSNLDFVHSLILWGMMGKTVRIAPQILPWLFESNYLELVDRDQFFQFPSQSLFISVDIDCYNGILLCKDYLEDALGHQFLINISLLRSDGGVGKQMSYVLPNKKTFNIKEELESLEFSETLFKVFHLILYVLNEYSDKDDFVSQNGVDYLGFYFAERFEQSKSMNGYWRKSHWHTYHVKDDSGELREAVRWIKPVWISR